MRGGGGGNCGGGLGERLLGCIGIDDDDMALLEVVDECVEVGEIQAATCVVAALGERGELTKHWGEKPGGLTSSSCLSSMARALTIEPRSLSTEEDILPNLNSLGLEIGCV